MSRQVARLWSCSALCYTWCCALLAHGEADNQCSSAQHYNLHTTLKSLCACGCSSPQGARCSSTAPQGRSRALGGSALRAAYSVLHCNVTVHSHRSLLVHNILHCTAPQKETVLRMAQSLQELSLALRELWANPGNPGVSLHLGHLDRGLLVIWQNLISHWN